MAAKKDAAAGDAVLEYLRSQNRPYSVNDIVLNLHKEHGKAAIQKALEKLVQDEHVREKTYGKQKVYLINQSGFTQATPEELKEMDKVIEDKEKHIKALQAQMKESQAELKAINSSMTTQEATALLEKLTRENGELSKKYEMLASSKVEVLDKVERNKIRTTRSKNLGEWRGRKKMCLSMVDGALEGWPGSKEELFEQAGIERDEDVGAILPSA